MKSIAVVRVSEAFKTARGVTKSQRTCLVEQRYICITKSGGARVEHWRTTNGGGRG